MESVTTTIFDTLGMAQAWLMPHLIAKSSASVDVTKEAWWTVLTNGRLWEWMCDIEVAISFLMLASVTTRAAWESEERRRTISSSSWPHKLFELSDFLVAKLKE